MRFVEAIIKMEVKEEKNIFLIGAVTASLPNGLPTVRDMLRVYFHYRLVLMKQKGPSVNIVAKDVIAQYDNLGIASIVVQDVVRKIHRVIDRYDSYKKSMHRESHTQRRNEKELIDLLSEQFNISPKVNYHFNKKKKLDQQSDQQSDRKSDQCKAMQVQRSDETVKSDICDDDGSSDEVNIEETDNDTDFEMNLSKYQRVKLSIEPIKKPPGVIEKIINSPDVSAVLDRTGISSPKFTLLCGAIAGVIGEDLNEVTLSASTVEKRRKIHRDRIVTIIKDDFMSSARTHLVLHWDGKKLLDTTNESLALRKKKVERLAVVVTGADTQKIITIAKTKDGTGLVTSETVLEHVTEWNLLEAIVAICTDTTASNTGVTNGSVVLFQESIQRNVLYFACRHHVDEIIIGGVFIGLFGETTGPSPELFENFKRDWHNVNKTSFKVSSDTECISY